MTSQTRLSKNNARVLLYFRTLNEQNNTFINNLFQAQCQQSLENWLKHGYQSFLWSKNITHVSILAEVNETIENAKNIVNVVELLPKAGDSGSQESDVEDVDDSMEDIFEPAGELEVDDDFESDEESETTLLSTRKKDSTMTLWLLKVQQHREIESSVAAELPLDVHFDGVNHFPGPATTQGRCKV